MAAACGASAVPRAAYIRSADAVCSAVARQVLALGPLPPVPASAASTASLVPVAAYLDRIVPLYRSGSERLHAIGVPDGGVGLMSRALTLFDEQISDSARAGAAARRGDVTGFLAAYDGAAASATRSSALAREFGLRVCGQGY